MNIRLKNISLEDNSIVRYDINNYYDCEENNKRLIENGYVRNSEGGWDKENIHIHKSLTETKETKYVIADIDWNFAHDEYKLISIGSRLLDLDDSEIEIVRDILKLMEKHNNKEYNY